MAGGGSEDEVVAGMVEICSRQRTEDRRISTAALVGPGGGSPGAVSRTRPIEQA